MGIGVGLASTVDFRHFTRHGLIFGPENKNVAIFPERIGEKYVALHRPSQGSIGAMGIWLASSPDLLHWGGHRLLMTRRAGLWDSERIGAGCVPFRVREGWMVIYHGVHHAYGYCLGAVLLDGDDPSRILARSPEPLMQPRERYECQGFYGKVVFSCGAVVREGLVDIYYGGADECTCLASIAVDELMASLAPL